MSPTRLYLNLGNTSLQWGLFEGGDWRDHGRFPAEEPQSTLQALRAALGEPDPPQTVAGCASRADVGAWRQAVLQVLPAPLELLGCEFEADFPTVYASPRQLGPDRLANLLAARALGLAPCLILDAGTCLTADVLSAEGRHLGGAIAAGLPALRSGILSRAPHLASALPPLGSIPADDWGRDTTENLALGLEAGLVGAATWLLARCRQMTPAPWRVILTGGDAGFLAAHLPEETHLYPTLTLDGVRLAYEAARQDD
ncbi:MAG TPA: type III pantothenate kinase [Armatimonadota bacterium]|jgi:type III pantothenate kinase